MSVSVDVRVGDAFMLPTGGFGVVYGRVRNVCLIRFQNHAEGRLQAEVVATLKVVLEKSSQLVLGSHNDGGKPCL